MDSNEKCACRPECLGHHTTVMPPWRTPGFRRLLLHPKAIMEDSMLEAEAKKKEVDAWGPSNQVS